jgi:hypothetical protein
VLTRIQEFDVEKLHLVCYMQIKILNYSCVELINKIDTMYSYSYKSFRTAYTHTVVNEISGKYLAAFILEENL